MQDLHLELHSKIKADVVDAVDVTDAVHAVKKATVMKIRKTNRSEKTSSVTYKTGSFLALYASIF